jgi:predicted DNA-binding protein (MmcQ/YjbR family)
MGESQYPPVQLPDNHYAREVKAYCLDLPDAWEDYPWGDIVYKVGAKMFVGLGTGGPVSVTVKATPEDAAVLVQMPHISVAPYVGRYGWVTVAIENDDALDQALALISMSYDLVREGGSRKRRRNHD